MAIIYSEMYFWYCDVCHDEGESTSEGGAERQANDHQCTDDSNDWD